MMRSQPLANHTNRAQRHSVKNDSVTTLRPERPPRALISPPRKDATRKPAIPWGQVLGSTVLACDVLLQARALAIDFHRGQEDSDYSGDLVETMSIPSWLPPREDWLPHDLLRSLNLRVAPEKPGEDLVVTCGTDPHVDEVIGPVLLLCLWNDHLEFRQGRARHVTRPGEYFVFDDFRLHEVRDTTASTAYLGWAVPLAFCR